MTNAVNNTKTSILLIEDNDIDALAVERALEKHMPYSTELQHVTTMADAEKRLTQSDKAENPYKPDVILLDLGLPDTADGQDSYNRIDAVKGEIPVIILTSMYDHILALGLIDQGAEDFVKKFSISVDPQILCDAIAFAICRHKKIEDLKDETTKLLKEKDNVINWMSGGSTP